jgi:predicted nucleic acid-binding protein
MPTSGRSLDVLADTSVAVAMVVEDHEHHASTLRAVGSRRVGLAGHAVFETFSVLTRLPAPARRSPDAVIRLMRSNFPENMYLAASAAEALLPRLASLGIAGGSVYDALVGAAAAESSLTLLTRDRRALSVYRVLGINAEILAG